jgi:hypothetical protein
MGDTGGRIIWGSLILAMKAQRGSNLQRKATGFLLAALDLKVREILSTVF